MTMTYFAFREGYAPPRHSRITSTELDALIIRIAADTKYDGTEQITFSSSTSHEIVVISCKAK